ncbi:MAG: hypothetical protein KGL39_30220 [Patescibacteria group bacterium]|nr:hypothetical protein [Patescibacteria group bacterium]
MADTSNHDNDHTPTLIAVSNADGVTPVKIYADPTTHRLFTTPATTSGSLTAQTTTQSGVATLTVGAADGTFLIMGSVLCTAYTSGNLNFQVVYTDPGSTVTTVSVQGHFTSGYGVNVSGTGDFEVQALSIRAKAGSTISINTAGTFTLTYNVYATIMQVA